jgi:hypothetical protein
MTLKKMSLKICIFGFQVNKKPVLDKPINFKWLHMTSTPKSFLCWIDVSFNHHSLVVKILEIFC